MLHKIILLISLFLLVSCSINQKNIIEKPLPLLISGNPVDVRFVKDFVTVQDDLENLPKTEIDLRYYQGVTIKDFINAVSLGVPQYGFSIDFIEPENELIVPRFKGSLQDLFGMLQKTYGFSYKRMDKNIIIEDNIRAAFKFPFVVDQKTIKDLFSIFSVSEDDIHIDYSRGVVLAIVSSKQYQQIRSYLSDHGIYQYQIDLAVVEDLSSSQRAVGVDLSQLSVLVGSGVSLSGTTFSVKSVSPNTAISASVNGWLSLDAVVAAYGEIRDTRLDQRLSLGLISGSTAKVDLARKVPYVSQITATSGSTGAAATGYQFEEAQDGLVIELIASGDSDTVNLDTSINYQQITEYLKLAVGGNNISRPVVQSRTYKIKHCMRPGEVSLVGSLRVQDDSHLKSGVVDLMTYSDNYRTVRDLSIWMGLSVIQYKIK